LIFIFSSGSQVLPLLQKVISLMSQKPVPLKNNNVVPTNNTGIVPTMKSLMAVAPFFGNGDSLLPTKERYSSISSSF
jgi:hypothetical protein